MFAQNMVKCTSLCITLNLKTMITNPDYLIQKLAEANEWHNTASIGSDKEYWRGAANAHQNMLNDAFPGWDAEGTTGWYVINKGMTYDSALAASAPVEWEFNFVGGGWNTVWARTREEAIQLAKEEYPKWEIAENSVHRSTPESMKANLSLFY